MSIWIDKGTTTTSLDGKDKPQITIDPRTETGEQALSENVEHTDYSPNQIDLDSIKILPPLKYCQQEYEQESYNKKVIEKRAKYNPITLIRALGSFLPSISPKSHISNMCTNDSTINTCYVLENDNITSPNKQQLQNSHFPITPPPLIHLDNVNTVCNKNSNSINSNCSRNSSLSASSSKQLYFAPGSNTEMMLNSICDKKVKNCDSKIEMRTKVSPPIQPLQQSNGVNSFSLPRPNLKTG